ncbi:PHP domain-containing protein [Odoribacter sp. OttesenSCG-928-J03]|nr:PHP domain-containing protein [Odoribacter sp. OttesenSCG-928-J03]
MKTYRADLHIHTVLSPCGDLEMSPANIIRIAKEKGLDIIGITDHNSTRQAKIIRDYGAENGIFVLTGAEVTTSEEAHCLAFLPGDKELDAFQLYLDEHLPMIKNNPDKFGYQVVVDVNDEILYQEEKLLIPGLNQSVEEVCKKVKELNGIFIPAHIDKKMYSILSQLGFIPKKLAYDALELSRHTNYTDFVAVHSYLKNVPFIQSSDSHYPNEIGSIYTELKMNNLSFENILCAVRSLIQN